MMAAQHMRSLRCLRIVESTISLLSFSPFIFSYNRTTHAIKFILFFGQNYAPFFYFHTPNFDVSPQHPGLNLHTDWKKKTHLPLGTEALTWLQGFTRPPIGEDQSLLPPCVLFDARGVTETSALEPPNPDRPLLGGAGGISGSSGTRGLRAANTASSAAAGTAASISASKGSSGRVKAGEPLKASEGEAGEGGLIMPQGAVAVHSVYDTNDSNVLERLEDPPRTGEVDGRGEAGAHALQEVNDVRVRFAH